MLPLEFGLLPNKEQRTYVRFMTMVKDKAAALGYHLNPVRIMQDFELGLMNANLLVFPGVAMKGVFFSLCSVFVAQTTKPRTCR